MTASTSLHGRSSLGQILVPHSQNERSGWLEKVALVVSKSSRQILYRLPDGGGLASHLALPLGFSLARDTRSESDAHHEQLWSLEMLATLHLPLIHTE